MTDSLFFKCTDGDIKLSKIYLMDILIRKINGPHCVNAHISGHDRPISIYHGSEEKCKNFVKEIIEKIERIENNKLVKVEESLKEIKEILMYQPNGPVFQDAKENFDALQKKQIEKIE